MFSAATCPLTHRPVHPSASLSLPRCNSHSSVRSVHLEEEEEGVRWRGWQAAREKAGMMEGLDLGMEEYPCMQNLKFTHPGWA